MLDSVSWVVHPLAGVTLAFFASVIFNPQRRQLRTVAAALVAFVLLSVLGAGWVVHPAAGISIAVLVSLAFHAWRTEWPLLLAVLAGLAVFMALGAGWAIFPLLGIGIAWLFRVVFSGDLFRAAEPGSTPAALRGTPAALPAQGGGEVFRMVAGIERVAARAERKMQRRVAKLERKAEKLGVPLRVSLEKSAPEGLVAAAQPPTVQPPASPMPATVPAATGLLALSRDERLPADARARLGALHFRCREAATYLSDHNQDLQGGSGFLLGQIETDYAPEAVRAYLKLPSSLANVTPLQDGKTGQGLLNEQLDLLLSAVQDILQGAAQAGGQHLLAHQRFLKERFAKPNDELKL